ncbi:uncharacterized protein LOC143926945 [Lithobates pipiens]
MVHTEGCTEGTPGPNCDAQSTVCLLDAYATDELHNVPLDVDKPPAPQGSAPECVVHNMAKKEMYREISRWEYCLGIFTFTVILLIALSCFILSLYMLYLHVRDHKLLQTLTEKLEAQSQILRQMAANQLLAKYNPGGL